MYSDFLEAQMPQATIATAMLFCHQFYMRQNHAKNYWQTIAAASMFLASKTEETPYRPSSLVVVAYKVANKWDPLAVPCCSTHVYLVSYFWGILILSLFLKDIYDKQKERIIFGERLLLATLAFDLNIENPYKPLVAAVKKLEISQKELVKVAWNFVNDWFRTTLCLQYKPHYIAAGSLFLAAKLQKVKLPTAKGKVWWMQFDVSPKTIRRKWSFQSVRCCYVIQQMVRLLEQNKEQVLPSAVSKTAESKSTGGKAMPSSPESCVSNGSVAAQDSNNRSLLDAEGVLTYAHSTCCQAQPCRDIHDNVKGIEGCQISDCGSASSIVENGNVELKMGQSEQNSGFKSSSCDAS